MLHALRPSVLLAACLLAGCSVVIMTQSEKSLPPAPQAKAGSTVCVLKDFDLDHGDWAAYIVTAHDDLAELPEGVPKRHFLKLDDRAVLKEMQRDWCFEITGGDLATVESYVAILQNGELRWTSGIVVSRNHEGLQSARFGWMKPKTPDLLSRYAKKFEPSILPLHIL